MYMEAIKVINLQGKPDLWLPPGFRFHPTDDELVSFYLTGKVLNSSFAAHAIAEVDLNKYEPWDLPEKANIGEKDQWYFFTLRDRKYPTGMRTNRATVAGYWKATGKDRDVISSRTSCLVGMKKTLVFYKGRVPRGEKTNWIMHEYRLEGNTGALISSIRTTSPKEWVVCRVFQKKAGAKKHMTLQTDKDVSYSGSEPPSPWPVADEAHLKATENADANSEVDWYNDQVSCTTSKDFDNRECFAPGNVNVRGNGSSFVGSPADNPSSIKAAIIKNSLYTDMLANESLSITAKMPIVAREHTSSHYSVPLSSSAINTLIKACKVEPSYSNPTVDHSLTVTTPAMAEIIHSWMGENMAMGYDNLGIRQLLPLQLLPPIESGMAADHGRISCIDHENPSNCHRFLRYIHSDPSSAMIQLEQ